MKGKILKWGTLILALSFLAGFGAYYSMRDYLPQDIIFDNLTKPAKEEAETNKHPFAGWGERKRQRALAVIIDNAPQARPQAGLEQAETVVEVPVEGGLTRFLAIICEGGIDTVGPIRSARPAFVDLATEYNAILVHAGGSEEALEAILREQPEHLDEIYGGIQAGSAFWRVPDRPKPYNLYSSYDSLRRAGGALKMNMADPPPQRPVLKPDADISGQRADDLTIFYPNKASQVRYVYNLEKRAYERFTGEFPHLTAKGEQLLAANVIVQLVPYRYSDGDGHLQLIMHGEGKALIFRDGYLLQGSWQKNPGEFTNITDTKGKPLALALGPTWIQIVPNGTRIDY